MLNALNFSNLSVEGYASFILALIFTIVTIAAAIYVARHKKLSSTMVIVFTLVLPMITIFCWVYLLMTILSQTLINTLWVSFVCALGYGIVALLIGFVANVFNKKEEAVENSESQAEEEKHEDPAVVAPLLIEVEAENTQEVEQEPTEAVVTELSENLETENADQPQEEVVAEMAEAENAVEEDVVQEDVAVQPVEEENVNLEENIVEPVEEDVVLTDEDVAPIEETAQDEVDKNQDEIETVEEVEIFEEDEKASDENTDQE